MSTTPVKPNRTPCLVVGGIAGCLVVCLATALLGGAWYFVMGPGRSAPIMDNFFSTPARPAPGALLPTPRSQPGQPSATRSPSQPVSPSGTQLFTGSAPFTVSYPLDWDVNDDEDDNQVVLFVSPDVDAYALVMYQPSTSAPADSLLNSMLDDLPGNDGSVKIISKKTNPDGSVWSELTYEDSDLGGTTHSYARVVKTKTNDYLVIFGTLNQDFAKYKDAGNAIVNSFSAR